MLRESDNDVDDSPGGVARPIFALPHISPWRSGHLYRDKLILVGSTGVINIKSQVARCISLWSPANVDTGGVGSGALGELIFSPGLGRHGLLGSGRANSDVPPGRKMDSGDKDTAPGAGQAVKVLHTESYSASRRPIRRSHSVPDLDVGETSTR
ncbi:hypothetical protein ElyMa_003528300 [Elysia marginata]|uniref:Uncharacterized protein n=1 Tax=Elysia marginata TaxID=1093978 RepID=A0AAV4EH34_9GAST|nr:hypothetical protein ElyMa_003528300 [Elysia marginata]